MLISQTSYEMTAVPGGVIEYIPTQSPLAILQDFPEANSCNWDLPEKSSPLSFPVQLDERIPTITLTYSSLSHDYENQIMNFKSVYLPLLQFLKTDAFLYEEMGNTHTTLFFDDIAHDLVGFCSTKCSSVKMKGNKLCSLCPTIEIAALCVSDEYRYMGIGQTILCHTLQQIYKIKNLVGVQLVTLFALPEAVAFYQKFKFCKLAKGAKIFCTPSHKHCIPMYLPLPHILETETHNAIQITKPLFTTQWICDSYF